MPTSASRWSSFAATSPAWRDGITHIVMSPLEFMQRLEARAPPRVPARADFEQAA